MRIIVDFCAVDVDWNARVNCDDIHIEDVRFRSIALRSSENESEVDELLPKGPRDPALLIKSAESHDDLTDNGSNICCNFSGSVSKSDKSTSWHDIFTVSEVSSVPLPHRW